MTAANRYAGHPPAVREALEVRANSVRNLEEVSTYLLAHLTTELTEAATPQQIADLWRDHALLVKRAAKRWEKAQATALEVLGVEQSAEVV